MANLSDLYPIMSRFAANAPKPLMMDAAQRMYRDFVRRSFIYKMSATITTASGQALYTITPPGSATVMRVGVVRESGKDYLLRPVTGEEYQAARSGKPTSFLADDDGGLTLAPVPDGEYSFTVEVYLLPRLTATVIPDSIFNDWAEVVAYGACLDLLIMPGKEWTNPDLAATLAGRYESGVNQAKKQYEATKAVADERAVTGSFA